MLQYLDQRGGIHKMPEGQSSEWYISVRALIRRSDGRFLFVWQKDADKWNLPGGGAEVTETVSQAAVREVREETGLLIVCDSEPFSTHNRGFYMSEKNAYLNSLVMIFHARLQDEISADDVKIEDTHEIGSIVWVEPSEIKNMDIHVVSQPALKSLHLL
jgi:8-oxo-dGTP pyrophosphatase MutT (NUDIX family)